MAEVKTLPETLLDEISVTIDEQQFFVRNPDAVSALDRMFVDTRMARLGIFLVKDENTPEEKEETERIVNRICRIAIDVPDDVFAKLKSDQRLRIVDFFIERLRKTPQGQKAQQQAGAQKAGRPTGRKSSRA